MTVKRPLYKWFYDNIHSHYYDYVTKWCFLPLGGETNVRRALVGGVGLREGDRVLEMCCGTGGTTAFIAAKVGRDTPVSAIDFSAGQIRIAKKKRLPKNIEFSVMDASNTSFEDGTFDKVVIPHALHEMARPARLAVLREARRVLAEGGALAVLEMSAPESLLRRLFLGLWWFYWLPFNPETPTRRDMLKHGLAEEVRGAGFRDVGRTPMFDGALQVVRGYK